MNKSKVQINKDDAQDVLKMVRIINNMTLKNYRKNWRKIHKRYGIDARYKLNIKDFSLKYGPKSKNIYLGDPNREKAKTETFRWLTVLYKNYSYRVTYDEKTDKFNAQSSFHNYREERIIIEEE